MFCSQCGTSNADGSQFCSKCGATLGSPSAPETAPSAIPVSAQPFPADPVQTSGKGLASLVCGVFFLVFPASVAAIILGHLSLSEIRKSAGRLGGHGMAMAGLILGYLGVAMIPLILIIAAIAIPNLLRIRQNSARTRLAANQAAAILYLREIVSADITYSAQFGNGFATSLEQLDGSGSGAGNCEHAPLIDHILASGTKNGYVFTYSAKPSSDPPAKGCAGPGASGFTVNADPITRNSTGMASYYVDETGVIRTEPSGSATADSQELR
jgi:type II secretory pathway pseudopilin PulG